MLNGTGRFPPLALPSIVLYRTIQDSKGIKQSSVTPVINSNQLDNPKDFYLGDNQQLSNWIYSPHQEKDPMPNTILVGKILMLYRA